MKISELVEQIEEQRIEQRIYMTELCKQAGITRRTYHYWLTGKANPKINLLESIMDVLGMEIEVKINDKTTDGND